MLYWAAPENQSGNRDGTWHPTVRSWTGVPGGPPTATWINNGNGTANFVNMGGATITTGTLISLRGIVSDTTAPVTITGLPPLSMRTLGTIDVANAPLILESRIDFFGGSLLKTGFGELDLRNRISPSTFEIREGLVTLSGENIGDSGSVVNHATLLLKDGERITNYTQNGGVLARAGSDSGNGTLTVTRTATLAGGLVTGRLSGKTVVTGDVSVSGWLGGSELKVESGTLDLPGSSDHSHIGIKAGGTVIVSGDGFSSSSALLENAGMLRIDKHDTIFKYLQWGGELAGSATLTAPYVYLAGGKVSGSLSGPIDVSGDMLVTGSLAGTELNIRHGTLTLGGSAANASITVFSGAGLNITGSGLAADSVLNNAGALSLGVNDTVSRLVQTNGSLVTKAGSFLTATDGAELSGGVVKGGLVADIDVRGTAHIDGGTIQGQHLTLHQDAALILGGSSSHREVSLLDNTSLETHGHLADDAQVATNGAREIVVRSDDTIRRLELNGGSVWGQGKLTVTDGITVRSGSLDGAVHGDVMVLGGPGEIVFNGSVSGGTLEVGDQRSLRLMGGTAHQRIIVRANAALTHMKGDINPSARVFNEGTISSTPGLEVDSLYQTGGRIGGSTLATTHGAFVSGGTVRFNRIEGDVNVGGDVAIEARLDGNLKVDAGHARFDGLVSGNTLVAENAGLNAVRIGGNIVNHGTLAVLDSGNSKPLEIGGDFLNTGKLELAFENASSHDRIKVRGTATLGGELLVNNTGEGLEAGEVAQLIKASTIVGAFEEVRTTGFGSTVIFDNTTGRLIGMAGGTSGPGGTYLNLNKSQTNIYLSLYEDAIGADETNVVTGGALRAATPKAAVSSSYRFLTGNADGDPQLVAALNAATFTQPGLINQPVINRLSPEVHRGMADYTRQALRAHVREASTAAVAAGPGKTQVFASAHTTSDGVESGVTDAGYQFESTGVTAGLRHDFDARTRAGALLGVDTGTIEGGLIDTDADNVTLGVFGSRVLHDKTRTALHAGFAWTSGTFDARRDSFGGEVTAEDISSKAVELSLGASTVAWQGRGFTVRPHAEIRHTNGSVDSFTESGAGVPLDVASQDIDVWVAELGVETSWKIRPDLELAGNIGYIAGLGDSDETLRASFARSGPGGRRFSVSAPGIEDDALVLGLGLYHDINETIRAGLTWQGELREGDTDSHSFGLGASWSF